MYSVYDEPLRLQHMKVKVADLLQEYQEVKARKIYHKIAYRYEIDSIIDKVGNYFNETADLGEEAMRFIQSKGLDNMPAMPPIIADRVAEIVSAFSADNPGMTGADRMALMACLFAEGGEFDGLYKEDGSVDEDWLKDYLADPDHLPEYHGSIPLTDEMVADMKAIDQMTELSLEEKEELFSSYFHEGGKYDGYIQLDGSVDINKIKAK